jgi:hypothetical protein
MDRKKQKKLLGKTIFPVGFASLKASTEVSFAHSLVVEKDLRSFSGI